MLPPELRALIDGTVEAVKDKPWAAAFHAVMNFREMVDVSIPGSAPPDTETEIWAGEQFGLLVACA